MRNGLCKGSDKALIDDFVNHLIIRTRNLRVSAVTTFNNFLDIFFDEIIRPESHACLQKIMVEQARNNPEIKAALRGLPQAKREALFHQKLKPFLMSQDVFDLVLGIMQASRPQFNLDEAAKNAQLKVLAQMNETLTKRAELLQHIQWSIRQYPPGSLILGDLGPVGKSNSGQEFKNPMLIENPSLILLPISNRCLLVGTKESMEQAVTDLDELNIASTELSAEFFIASQDSQKERDYHVRLGSRSQWGEKNEMRSIVQDGFKEM
jgi:hypothetical protein